MKPHIRKTFFPKITFFPGGGGGGSMTILQKENSDRINKIYTCMRAQGTC